MKKTLLVLTIFLGSFISFALEPMIGRTLLPAFGGASNVWVTCLATFQLLMVGGYFYAERGMRDGGAGIRRAIRVHLGLLVLAAAWCVVVGCAKGSILATLGLLTGVPVLDVFLSVVALAGVTFVLLSANATVVQVLSGGDYRLYAWSNAGSLIGLLAYPLVFEPFVGVGTQWVGLGTGIVIYGALLWMVAREGQPCASLTSGEDAASPLGAIEQSNNRTILYYLIPGVTCAFLNAMTTHLTQDVMPLPLLWAVILGLFLLSYIIGFSGCCERFLTPLCLVALLVAVAFGGCSLLLTDQSRYLTQLLPGLAAILLVTTCLHAVLYSIRPAKERLTSYYLANVIGGAVGGILTGIVAPLVLDRIVEHVVLLVAACALIAVLMRGWKLKAAGGALAAATCALLVVGANREDGKFIRTILHARDFYGAYQVRQTLVGSKLGRGTVHGFNHGTIAHGVQLRLPTLERMATSYYTVGGAGYAIAGHPKYQKGEPMRVNLVGLGMGVLFSYGRTNDYYRAYEISDAVRDIALNRRYFSFVSDCPAKKDIVLGDARKGLEAELAAGVEPYDVIVVDAYSGDAIPYHLSSKEAFELYFKLLKPDGILCLHISNRYLNLLPFAKTVQETFDCPMMVLLTNENRQVMSFMTLAAYFCRDMRHLARPPVGTGPGMVKALNMKEVRPMAEMPTDDKGSFIHYISF